MNLTKLDSENMEFQLELNLQLGAQLRRTAKLVNLSVARIEKSGQCYTTVTQLRHAEQSGWKSELSVTRKPLATVVNLFENTP